MKMIRLQGAKRKGSIGKVNNPKGNPHLVPRWKKGQSGNPNGRPKKALCIPDLLSDIGDEMAPPALQAVIENLYESKKKLTMREALLRATYVKAIEGESWAVDFIASRTEGRVSEKLQVEDLTPKMVVFKEVRLQVGDSIKTVSESKTTSGKALPPPVKVIEGELVDE